jgi:competence protein ComEC
MFTFIAIGSSLNSRNSIYNSLAVSAFVLLCYNPYLLWDVGFQLSYLAVLGIVICQKYVYNWFNFKNKFVNEIWELASISLAAQVFTLPVCIYYFHQFPLLFLLSNMVAIPLSTLVLFACIALVAISPIPLAAMYLGKLIWAFIWLLDLSILGINAIPFSLWGGLFISITETIILYFIVIACIYWLIKKNMPALKLSVVFILLFACSLSYKSWNTIHQNKMIIYNIPQHKAIDFIHGHQYYFIGDDEVIEDYTLKNYNIQPAHIKLGLHFTAYLPKFIFNKKNFYQFYNCRILMIDSPLVYKIPPQKIKVDYIILSKNPPLHIASIASIFDCKKYIFDASNSLWKIGQWKKECEELHLHFHSVPGQGAFITDL